MKRKLSTGSQPKIDNFFHSLTSSSLSSSNSSPSLIDLTSQEDSPPLSTTPIAPKFSPHKIKSKPVYNSIEKILNEIKEFVGMNLKIDAVAYIRAEYNRFELAREFAPDSQIRIAGVYNFAKFIDSLHNSFVKPRDLSGTIKDNCSYLIEVYSAPATKWPEYSPNEIQRKIVEFSYQKLETTFQNVQTKAHPDLTSLKWSSENFKKGIAAFSPLYSAFIQFSKPPLLNFSIGILAPVEVKHPVELSTSVSIIPNSSESIHIDSTVKLNITSSPKKATKKQELVNQPNRCFT